jgi:hypothetical protein
MRAYRRPQTAIARTTKRATRSTPVKLELGSRKLKGLNVVGSVAGAVAACIVVAAVAVWAVVAAGVWAACAPREATPTAKPRSTTRDTTRLRRLFRLRDPVI